MIAHPGRNVIVLEIRSEADKNVKFTAVDLDTKTTLFRDLSFDESWWISLAEVSGDLVLFKIYTDTNNPDKKSVIAYDFLRQQIVWWRNNFAVSAVTQEAVLGSDSSMGMKFLALNLQDGTPLKNEANNLQPQENFLVRKPLQYFQDTSHFETVKTFLQSRFGLLPVSVIEYLEYGSMVLISMYVMEQDLANYLIVISREGALALKEKLGEGLKGIGTDTFFLFSGYLIFVKNNRALVSYKMV